MLESLRRLVLFEVREDFVRELQNADMSGDD